MPPEPRRPGTAGRPRKRGARRPTPAQGLGQRGRRVDLEFDGDKRRSQLVETVARWHNVPDRPLKVVAVEPLGGERRAGLPGSWGPFRQGLYWYHAMPTMRDAWLEQLIVAFNRIVADHRVFREIFAVI